jgi:hypothetical protein
VVALLELQILAAEVVVVLVKQELVLVQDLTVDQAL